MNDDRIYHELGNLCASLHNLNRQEVTVFLHPFSRRGISDLQCLPQDQVNNRNRIRTQAPNIKLSVTTPCCSMEEIFWLSISSNLPRPQTEWVSWDTKLNRPSFLSSRSRANRHTNRKPQPIW